MKPIAHEVRGCFGNKTWNQVKKQFEEPAFEQPYFQIWASLRYLISHQIKGQICFQLDEALQSGLE